MSSIDLYNNKYDRQTLKEHIYELSLTDIVKTQVLDESFIVKYILNDKYCLRDGDKYITLAMVLEYQPHIILDSILNALEDYDSDDDSIEDFETYSNRR